MFTTLTRPQFDDACRRYVDAHSGNTCAEVKTFPTGWTWCEHPYVSGLGYLSRVVLLSSVQADGDSDEHEADIDGDEDDATAASDGELLTCKQYVVYSPTYEVPAFYFTLHDRSGSPLTLEQIARSALFRRHALPSPDGSTFGLILPDSSLALLSQGDHPTLGTPSWYFHPCHTSEVVGEIMAASDETRTEDKLLRWMEVWFMVLSNLVDFFAGGEI
ncbi:hypothetical protein C8Q77DRAFT_1205909 [Trametes polyzona]|nr:hypothetical protein C8Q77DRAFT_1205909 [Trametes polyzona]